MHIAITLERDRVNDLYRKADELGAEIGFSDRYNKGEYSTIVWEDVLDETVSFIRDIVDSGEFDCFFLCVPNEGYVEVVYGGEGVPCDVLPAVRRKIEMG